MKQFTLMAAFLLTLLITTSALAFVSQGNTNISVDYKNLKPSGDGYTFTIINLTTNSKYEFYLITRGFDAFQNEIYRKRFYVEFLGGNGELDFYLPGYDKRILDWKIEIQKNKEIDVHIRKP